MKGIKAILLVFLVCSLCFCIKKQPEEKDNSCPYDDLDKDTPVVKCDDLLDLQIESNKKYYDLNEEVILDVRLINNSPYDPFSSKPSDGFNVFGVLVPNSCLVFMVFDEHGNYIKYRGMRLRLAHTDNTLIFWPRTYIGRTFVLNNDIYRYNFTKGKYAIKVKYLSSFYDRGSRIIRSIDIPGDVHREKAICDSLVSNEIEIVVR